MAPLLVKPKPTSRLFLVSNRLPVSVHRSEDGEYTFSQGSGGLVSGLEGLSVSTKFLWYGWPGIEVPKAEQAQLAHRLQAECNAFPVFLDAKDADLYYNGFSNSILWPLLHYHPGEILYSEDDWQAYQKVNKLFAEALVDDVEDGDLVWIHDYHLMLLPEFLKSELSPEKMIKIGFFLHTPFPSSEVYRILPVRKQILKGMLHCDLVGFHTRDYARHFLSSCSIVLDLPTTTRTVTFEGNFVNAGTFPIGIQPAKFHDTLLLPAVQQRIAELKEEFSGKTVMVGVDRLDYIKGLPLKLRAFEMFLDDHPECVGSLVLLQIAIPTRGSVEEYQNLRAVVNELIGRINGKFGRFAYTPIHFMHQAIPFQELLALYSISSCCIVASTRDGMNLVSFEYIACQQGSHGSLILSEFTGSSQSLTGAIIVNPWNIHDMARAIRQAYYMDDVERKSRYEQMEAHVQKFTSAFWGKSFIDALTKVGKEPIMDDRLWMNPKERTIDWRSYDG